MGVESDDEFRDFMRGRWSAMVRLAYTLTGDQGHAEDIAQAAFSSAYSAWGRVSGPAIRTRTCGPSDPRTAAVPQARVREACAPPSRNAAPALMTAWPTGRRCTTR